MLPLAVGLGIAGLAGGIGSAISADGQMRDQRRAQAAYDDKLRQLMLDYQNRTGDVINQYDAQSLQYLNDPSKVQQWLNPNISHQLQSLSGANRQRFAAGGKMLSGAEQRAYNRDAQEVGKLSFSDAFNMMNASNNQGLGNLQSLASMKTDMAGNVFNVGAQGAMNNLNASMGQKQASVGDFLTGFGAATQGVGSVANAFRGK